MKKIVILPVVLAVVAGALWWNARRDAQEATNPHLYGNVDVRQVDTAFRVGGRLQELNVEEGDSVKTGDVIARLDPVPYQETYALAEATLAGNVAKVQGAAAQLLVADAQLSATTAQSAGARATMEKVKSGNRKQEIQTAVAQMEAAKIIFTNADKEFNRQTELAKNGTISQQQFDNTRTVRDNALAQMNVARETLNLMQEGSRQEDIAVAVAAYNSAEANMESAKANRAAAQAQYLAAIATRDATAAQLRTAQTQLEDTVLTAPAEGFVMTRVHEPGEMLQAGTTVLTLTKINPTWVRAYIPEPMLGRLKPGMKARVMTDDKTVQPLEGTVGFISPEAEFTPKNVQTPELRTQLVYRFRVIVPDPEHKLRQGMPVTVKLVE